MPRQWYVLRSKPRKEAALERYARLNGYEVFYPTIPVKPVNPRASKVKAYFPGYLFVRVSLSKEGEYAFRWVPFSAGMVHIGGEPARVPDSVIRAIRSRVGEIWEAGGLAFSGFEKGDRVLIQEGTFEGYEAIFDARVSGRKRVRVLLKMLSDRFVAVELENSQIQKAH